MEDKLIQKFQDNFDSRVLPIALAFVAGVWFAIGVLVLSGI